MHPVLTEKIVQDVKRRIDEGDRKTIPSYSVEQLEFAIEELASRRNAMPNGLGWLIETGDHKYWNGKYANADGFTHDANDAVRFARFEDSERVIYWLLQEFKVFLVSRQHKFL